MTPAIPVVRNMSWICSRGSPSFPVCWLSSRSPFPPVVLLMMLLRMVLMLLAVVLLAIMIFILMMATIMMVISLKIDVNSIGMYLQTMI